MPFKTQGFLIIIYQHTYVHVHVWIFPIISFVIIAFQNSFYMYLNNFDIINKRLFKHKPLAKKCLYTRDYKKRHL